MLLPLFERSSVPDNCFHFLPGWLERERGSERAQDDEGTGGGGRKGTGTGGGWGELEDGINTWCRRPIAGGK